MKSILITSLALLSLSGCVDDAPHLNHPVSDVPKTNAVRKTLGIREVKPEWEFYIHQFDEDIWKDGEYECKKVKLDTELGHLLWEQDYYYTGSTWSDHDGTHWENVTVTYDYQMREFSVSYSGTNPKLRRLVDHLESGSISGYKAETNKKTLEVADKMLSFLGLKRL